MRAPRSSLGAAAGEKGGPAAARNKAAKPHAATVASSCYPACQSGNHVQVNVKGFNNIRIVVKTFEFGALRVASWGAGMVLDSSSSTTGVAAAVQCIK